MNNIRKSIIASAVAVAIAAPAGAVTLEQLRNGATVSIQGQDRQVTLEQGKNIKQQPSAFLIELNVSSTSTLMQGKQFDAQRVGQLTVQIEDAQQQVSNQLLQLNKSAKVLGTTKYLAASIVVSADEASLKTLAKNPLVKKIYPVYDSKPLVADSQEYIKAASVVNDGVATGAGIKVAILDTGIDYTHAALGGAGTEEAYAAAFANQSGEVTWPQGSVIGGYDFVANDPNPIDDVLQGHGTSVANSVNGIAPDVSFYGFRVCAPAPVNCTGLAQINALEAAMDPNGDGDLSDRVDVVNMSLGGDFGSTDTSSGTQLLIQRAVELGVSMVISAGNDGPNPFIVGGPSTTPNALSVGAMTHPTILSPIFSASTVDGEEIDVSASSFNPTQEFSFSSATTPLVYEAANGLACDAFAEGVDFTGKAVMVDRGACNFTQKVLNAQAKGAAFVLIANSAANAGAGATAPGGSAPGITIPSVGISYELGMAIKEKLAAETEVTYAITTELVSMAGAIADFTSRGPSMDGLLKPEITAPGVSIMVADVGTGDGLAPASGTSFSGPITAGAISLLRNARPELNAFEAKAMLMNTANLEVRAEPLSVNADAPLAPISTIGAGLVNVKKAVESPAVAWVYDAKFDTKQAALSFGLQTMTKTSSMTKTVTLKNFSTSARTYTLSTQARFEDDADTGALSWTMPASVMVGAGQTVTFDVTATIDPTKLPEWSLENGTDTSEKNDLLTTVEFDGALVLNDTSTGDDHDLHLVYHVIPKANADLKIRSEITEDGIRYVVKNDGAVTASPYTSQLVATDGVTDVAQDIRSVSLDVIPVPTGYCTSGYALAPTFTLDKPLMHMLQASFSVILDVDNDETWDYELHSILLSRFGTYADNPAYTGYVGSFATPFGQLSGAVGDAFQVSGQRSATLIGCFEDLGLTEADIGNKITAAFVTFNDGYAIGVNWGTPIDDLVIAETPLVMSPNVGLTDADGESVDAIEPGGMAYLEWDDVPGTGFALMSDVGDAVATADLTTGDQAPVVTAGQSFAVAENTATGTVIGKVDAAVDFSSPVSEFLLAGSTSSAVAVNSNGDIVVANSALLNYDAGLTTVQLEVIALDTEGNASAPTTVMVNVTNVADEMPVVTAAIQVADVKVGSSSGAAVGTVNVAVKEAGATLTSVQTNNNLFAVVSGKLVLTRTPTKSDAKSHAVVITATDSSGMQGTATVNVTVSKSSSGSFGFLSLLALPLLLLRRRRG